MLPTSNNGSEESLVEKTSFAEKDDLIVSTARTQTNTTWSPISSDSHTFVPALEGLRGLAVLLVMFCHCIEEPFILREASGSTGVTVFFVLSGFLITGVLIRLQKKSVERNSTFGHLGVFYADRTVRLLPALVFMIAAFYYIYAYIVKDSSVKIGRYSLLALFYCQNLHGLWASETDPGVFGHMWSLACEEQYYIVWALVLPFILRGSMRKRTIIMGLSMAISFYARVITSMYPGTFFGAHWHDSLFTNVWKMLLGSALRIVPVPRFLRSPIWAYVGLAGLAGTLKAMTGPQPFDYWNPRYGPGWQDLAAGSETWTDPLSAFFTAIIIISLHGKNVRNWLLETRTLRFCGKVSYSWYLWHYPTLVYFGWQRGIQSYGNVAIAFMVAMFSTYIVEEPISLWYKAYKQRKGH